MIADEAHRSQYDFEAKVERKTATSPTASPGTCATRCRTPRSSASPARRSRRTDANTPAVFGDYIDIYDIQRAVEDGATVPIYYESRLARIELDEDEKPKIDAEIRGGDRGRGSERARSGSRRKWAQLEALVGAEKRLELVAEDLVKHFEDRLAALDGKAMIVCMSRRICVDALRRDREAAARVAQRRRRRQGAIKVVMTGSASDPPTGSRTSATRRGARLLAKRFKDPNDPLKLVIVRDMWLTGFDAPCLHTMYVDKPMRGHGLMQAIARVNRVFRDKPGGLVVDYIGIAQNLKSALGQYSGPATASRPASTRPRPSACCWRNTRSSGPCSGPTPRAGSTTARRSSAAPRRRRVSRSWPGPSTGC